MAYSLDDIKKYSQDPSSIGSSGSYGEGQVQNIYNILSDLKSQVQSGKVSIVDFQKLSDPLIQRAAQQTGSIAGRGSKAANAVNSIWNQFTQNGFAVSRGGQWVSTLPFNRQEYAALPNNVLPSQNDIKNGMFDPSTAPIPRYQTPEGGSTSNPLNTNTPTPVLGPDGQPLPQFNPTIPAGVDTRTDQGQIALQGAQNASQLQEALNKQYQVNQQAVSQLGQSLSGIPDIYKNEGLNQQQQLMGLADQQKSARSQALTDLASTLAQNQMNLFNRSIPDLAEQANTRGIYRSTGFGDILANKYNQLTQDTQTQLALQGISDRDIYLNAQSNALNQALGYSGQAAEANANRLSTVGSAGASALQAYGSGLGDVANAAIGMQNAGLQRQFSLSDFITQQNAAAAMADKMKTQGPTGKASPGTQAWMGGATALLNPAARMYSNSSSGGKAGGGSQAVGAGMSPQFGSVGTPLFL